MGPQVWITEVIFKSNSFLANSRDQLEPVVTQIPNHVATQYDKYLLQIYLFMNSRFQAKSYCTSPWYICVLLEISTSPLRVRYRL